MTYETIGSRMAATRGATSGFDYLRLAAAFMVVAYHARILLGGEAAIDAWESTRWASSWVLPAFFILSGFLVTASLHRNPTIADFCVARVARIYPGLIVVILLSTFVLGPLVTNCSLHDYFSSRLTLLYLKNLLGAAKLELPGVFATNPFPHVNTAIWTVYWEMCGYALLLVLALIGASRKRGIMLAMLVLFGLACTYVAYYMPQVDAPGAMLMDSFAAGMVLYLFKDKIPASLPLFLLCGATFMLLMTDVRNDNLAVIPIAYCVLYVGTFNPPKKTFLMRGDYSLGLYLSHFPIAQLILHLFPSVHSWWVLESATMVLGLAYAHWSWYHIEKPALAKRKAWAALAERALPGSRSLISGAP